ncbi:MAG TPA: NrdH-redoxin [Synergistaceae bacterium]|jgi:glutaredoxin-like YruB-family protein|nr:NrdH-redoxin [Synergistaceae bacterium]
MIRVYSTPTCPWCTKAKQYLEGKKVAFEDINVAQDREAAKDVVAKTGQMGVPVIQIGERYIVGYDTAAIDEELAKLK